jgi:hypothetical protein
MENLFSVDVKIPSKSWQILQLIRSLLFTLLTKGIIYSIARSFSSILGCPETPN